MGTRKCTKCKKDKNIEEFHFIKTEKRYNSWCKVCLYQRQKNRWVELKKKIITVMGGKCCKCGYNKNDAALCIHHLNNKNKNFDWNQLRLRTWNIVEKEINKCILVCCNCHAEIHYPELNTSP